MRSLASLALADAALAHQEQHRWGNGEPYFNHVWRVYHMVRRANPRVAIQAAAALHDTLEDNPLFDFHGAGVGESGLRRKYGAEVARIVVRLTHRDDRRLTDSEYRRYIDQVRRDPDAALIKVADLLDNLHGLPQDHKNYARYHEALAILDPDGDLQRSLGVRGRAVRQASRATIEKHLAGHQNVPTVKGTTIA